MSEATKGGIEKQMLLRIAEDVLAVEEAILKNLTSRYHGLFWQKSILYARDATKERCDSLRRVIEELSGE